MLRIGINPDTKRMNNMCKTLYEVASIYMNIGDYYFYKIASMLVIERNGSVSDLSSFPEITKAGKGWNICTSLSFQILWNSFLFPTWVFLLLIRNVMHYPLLIILNSFYNRLAFTWNVFLSRSSAVRKSHTKLNNVLNKHRLFPILFGIKL